ncbi:MAG: sulfite exporter TauE/SafE family protein [Sumerlaeia bacterium]
MTLLQGILLLLAGLIAGVVNTVAGGGSLLTLPALIFSGIPSVEANATNRLGVLAQGLVSTPKMFQATEPATKSYLYALLPTAILGGILGTWLAANISGQQFDKALGVCMIIMLILIFRKTTFTAVESKPFSTLSQKKKLLILVSFFGLGFYAGFIQAGMGMVTLLVLSLLSGMTLVQANALKVMMILLITSFALLIFVLAGIKIHLLAGLILSAGQMVGAGIGTRLALGAKGEQVIRFALIAMTLLSAAKLFFGV